MTRNGDAMAEGEEIRHLFPGGPPDRRRQKRWAIAAGIGVAWVLLIAETGSFIGGTVVSVLLAAVAAGAYAGLRALGFDSGHPWIHRMRTRPWRNGQDVLRLALRHLPEVLIITPNRSQVAPNSVELQMNPDDLAVLAESLDLDFINSSATEYYEDMLRKRGIHAAKPGPVHVSVVGNPAIPAGRYQLRKAQPANTFTRPDEDLVRGWYAPEPAPPAGAAGPARPVGPGQPTLLAELTGATGLATIKEATMLPRLRLITDGRVAETDVSGARAGRSRKLELGLPADPTVSRVHAQFTFDEGQWWITNLGRNGIAVNGQPVQTRRAVHGGDSIRWGQRPDALVSRVEIDWPGQAA